MAQTQAAGGPSEPDATGGSVGGSMPDSPEFWGNNGLVGDGRYRLTHRLGRGGMAEVFGAEDVRLGRTVAVKLLRSDLAEDPVSKARFTREAQSVAGLNHHAVVAVYDSGEEFIGGNVTPYIVMELVEGSTIRELLLNAESPPADQALIIVSGVLEALAYSHQHGIVHRDIKPANVIITAQGAVKVMDFGIARALHGASNTMTQTGMVMGTPQYLSPEQALGKTVDTRSDLYATGCLLYELLALRPPFTGETPLSVVYQHVQDTAVAPSQVSDAVPPELDGLVMRSLAKDPDDRFQSAEEMRGLVQYALRMLHEQGSHTGGLWNTGPVGHGGGSTPAMGIPGAGAQGHPHSDTSQMGPPLLMGRPDRDDGGFDGGTRAMGADGGRKGGGFKYALIAFLAVIAIAAGIFFALDLGGGDGEKKDVKPDTSTSAPKDDETTEEPSEAPSETEQDPGTTTGGDDDGTWEPAPTATDTTPTDDTGSPTDTPSDTPTDPGTSNGGGAPGGGGTNTGGDPGGTGPTGSPDDPAGGTEGDTAGEGDNGGEAGAPDTGGTTGG
ncbi:serine/threonine protein kinase [Streptomyces armeniacus]|uniref:non-specific serine/threonine protein kinase n=1 Tax=Streptomyces armeniacus TaxID=83291 RepID=A0A345XJ91_9ACTN|nr:protein kinase [Streptomyces armeniacus]AXK31707.1 serine/threonine protein kinase [Streptomyces armeniacus]